MRIGGVLEGWLPVIKGISQDLWAQQSGSEPRWGGGQQLVML